MASGHRGLQPRKQPRQARAALTRQRILDAAARVFAEYGYAAGTTNRIAERARVSIGSLYQYYPNKDAILVELLTRHLDAGMIAAPPDQDEPLPESIEGIMRFFVRNVIENHREDPQLLRVMMEQGPRAPELLEKIAQSERRHIAYSRQAAPEPSGRAGHGRGHRRPPRHFHGGDGRAQGDGGTRSDRHRAVRGRTRRHAHPLSFGRSVGDIRGLTPGPSVRGCGVPPVAANPPRGRWVPGAAVSDSRKSEYLWRQMDRAALAL